MLFESNRAQNLIHAAAREEGKGEREEIRYSFIFKKKRKENAIEVNYDVAIRNVMISYSRKIANYFELWQLLIFPTFLRKSRALQSILL